MAYLSNIDVDRYADVRVNFSWVAGKEQIMTLWTFDFKLYKCGTQTVVFTKSSGFTLSDEDKKMSFDVSAADLALLTDDCYDFRLRKTSPGTKVLTRGCWKFQ